MHQEAEALWAKLISKESLPSDTHGWEKHKEHS